MPENLQLILLILALLVAVLGIAFEPLTNRWRDHTKRVSTCGYVAPPPSDKAFRVLMLFAKLKCFVQVGKINVQGKENLESIPGPFVYCSNHPFAVDAYVTALVLNRKVRCMARQAAFQRAGGLGARIASRWGAFVGNDDIRDGGVRARAAAAEMLSTGQTVVVFPGGGTTAAATMELCREGAVRIVKQTVLQTGANVWIVPAFMRYGKYPGKFLKRFPQHWQQRMVLLLFPLYRRDVTVVIGKPISAVEFADEPAEATLELMRAMQSLDPA